MKLTGFLNQHHVPGMTLICLLLSSCGAVHQMIPPAPLSRNEFRGSFVISYDFNRFAPVSSFGMNFYWGAGKDYNIGFGYQPPLGISHLTAVKYFNPEKPKYENLYASLNGVFLTTDYSPDLEIGASYMIKDNRSIHAFSSGFWILLEHDAKAFYIKMILSGSHLVPNAGPFIKYEYSHKDIGICLKNNIGLTRRVVSWYRETVDNAEYIDIPNLDINYVTFNANSHDIQISTKYSQIYRITMNYPGADAWWPDIVMNRLKTFTYPDSIDYYRIVTLKQNPDLPGNRWIEKAELYELNYDGILSDYVGKKDIVIASYPGRTDIILRRIHWYRHDWSIAIATRMKH